jgi:hypothetical protein
VLIKITYVTELSVEGPNIAFVLPASVSPPQRDKALKDVTQTVTKTVNVEGDVTSELPLDLQVSIDMPYPIVRLKSSSHPGKLLIKQTQTKATVQLKPDTSLEGRPFTLLVGLEKPYEPRMWVCTCLSSFLVMRVRALKVERSLATILCNYRSRKTERMEGMQQWLPSILTSSTRVKVR